VGLPVFLGAMAAMMLPSELPFLRLDHATARSSLRTAFVACGYLMVWIAFATPLFFVPAPPWELAIALAAAYQLTPVKRRCLTVCRSPLAFIVHGWRDGLGGALRTGVERGVWCAGCCVGAMVVLLAVGMMSIWWMAVVGAVIFVEKRGFAVWAIR
jgi:predicted metal-binding membrane protein